MSNTNIDVILNNNQFYIEAQQPNKTAVEITNPNYNDINIDVIDKDIIISSSGGIVTEVNNLSENVTWTFVPDAYITESSVTQHQGALSITESQISDFGSYLTNINSLSINELSDVDTVSVAPLNNQVLAWNSTDSSWQPTTISPVLPSDLSVDSIAFNITADPAISHGVLGWNQAEGTLTFGLENNTEVHIGEHNLFRVRNNTGSTLYAGQPVYAVGIHNNSLLESDLYVADGSIREIRFFGLIIENVAKNQKGYAINFGHIEGINTIGNGIVNGAGILWDASEPAWVDGDILYVHPTIPGKLTKVEPKHSISVAIVMYAHQNNGRLFVRPVSYGHLSDNHDVDISSVTNGQTLRYNASTDYWTPGVLHDNGTNIGVDTNNPTSKLDINSDTFRLRSSKTPTSASQTCNQGDICWDSSYIYICVANNTWKKSLLSSW